MSSESKVVVAPPDSLRRRRLMGALVIVAFAIGAGGFGYAIRANTRATHSAQVKADQAARTQLYALQLFCTVLRAQQRNPGLHDGSAAAREDLAGVVSYYRELKCPEVLAKPRVPLSQVTTTPPGGSSPRSRAGPSTPPVGPSPAPTPAAGSSPPRTPPPSPGPSPSRSPSPSPSRTPFACVTVGPASACATLGPRPARVRSVPRVAAPPGCRGMRRFET